MGGQDHAPSKGPGGKFIPHFPPRFWWLLVIPEAPCLVAARQSAAIFTASSSLCLTVSLCPSPFSSKDTSHWV